MLQHLFYNSDMDTLQVLDALIAGDLDPGTSHDLSPSLKLHIVSAGHIAITRNGKQVRSYWNSFTLPPVVPQVFLDKLK